jgi:hypothetical protein
MEWDMDSFNRTAKAVLLLNPHVRDKYPDVESMVSFMRHVVMTDIVPRGGTHCGTCGFDLFVCPRPGRESWVRASISSILLDRIETLSHPVKTSFSDVHVIDLDVLDTPHPLPWLVQWESGEIAYFDDEETACAVQRLWRQAVGLDPITGTKTS